MTLLGSINERSVRYIKYDMATTWFDGLPKKNWLLFVITDNYEREIFDEIIRRAIDRNVCYLCAAGRAHRQFEDDADEIIVHRDVENEYLPEHHIVTTSQEDVNEEFWFAVMADNSEQEKIEQVICLDLGVEECSTLLKDLIRK